MYDKPLGVLENLPYNPGNLSNTIIINDNEVSTYNWAFTSFGELTFYYSAFITR